MSVGICRTNKVFKLCFHFFQAPELSCLLYIIRPYQLSCASQGIGNLLQDHHPDFTQLTLLKKEIKIKQKKKA